MLTNALLISCLVLSFTLDELRQMTAARYAALDKLRIAFNSFTYVTDRAEDRNDPASWRPTENIVHSHAITIVRPGFLHDWMTDNPERGYAPVRNSVSDGVFVRQWVQPMPTGELKYHIDETTTHCAPFTWLPIPWVFDLNYPDSLQPAFNTLAILNHESAQVVGSVDGCTRVRAAIPNPGAAAYTMHCEIDFNAQATPVRACVTLDFENPSLESSI